MRKILRKAAVVLCICLLLPLAACGGPTDDDVAASPTPSVSQPVSGPETSPSPSPSAEPFPPPYDGPVNPLTGMPMDGEQTNARPVAVMINNLVSALPQQGNGGADILYEMVAEGGITRMVAVYQSLDGVGTIGSVRSARSYYIELALAHDAVFIHAGGSEEAYTDLSAWNVDHLDGVRGVYSSSSAGLFWRDRDRVPGHHYDLEHSLVTSGEAIQTVLGKSSLRLEHEDGYTCTLSFADDGTPAEGVDAAAITVPFSKYKTGVFRYDADSGCYLAEQFGEPYTDGNTGEQIAVTNVLILRASIRGTGDSYGHMTADLSGGDGWFACGGKLVPITWTKDGVGGQFCYYAADGSALTLGRGKSYVNIISAEREISYS